MYSTYPNFCINTLKHVYLCFEWGINFEMYLSFICLLYAFYILLTYKLVFPFELFVILMMDPGIDPKRLCRKVHVE